MTCGGEAFELSLHFSTPTILQLQITKIMNYKNLDPADFKKAIAETENALVLDVRTPAEIAGGKIEGAIELDFFAADFANKILELDQDKTYFVYCRSGNRSGQACSFMAQNGFPTPVNLQGGIMAWESVMA